MYALMHQWMHNWQTPLLRVRYRVGSVGRVGTEYSVGTPTLSPPPPPPPLAKHKGTQKHLKNKKKQRNKENGELRSDRLNQNWSCLYVMGYVLGSRVGTWVTDVKCWTVRVRFWHTLGIYWFLISLTCPGHKATGSNVDASRTYLLVGNEHDLDRMNWSGWAKSARSDWTSQSGSLDDFHHPKIQRWPSPPAKANG